ncbi:MAG: Fe-S cluster assembly protein SufD, partial [Pseudomonadota bacterium]
MTATDTQANEPAQFDDAGFEKFLTTLNEPTWLLEQRKQAWGQFQSLEWPSRKEEDWMRSDLRAF